VYDRHTIRKIASIVHEWSGVRAICANTLTCRIRTYYAGECARADTSKTSKERPTKSPREHGQLYTRQLPSVIVSTTNTMGEVLGEEGSLFPLQRKNLLPTSRHLEREKDDLTFRAHSPPRMVETRCECQRNLPFANRKEVYYCTRKGFQQGTKMFLWEAEKTHRRRRILVSLFSTILVSNTE
jgi:hypothetical protein